jgi:pimeloyl-ACP methyl ester carboxylesterase
MIRVSARGLGLALFELSKGPGVPVLCLHGWLDQAHAFWALAQGRPGRWLAMDHRGHGASDPIPPGCYPYLADMVADLDAVVSHLGEPVHLVGHSMGGTLALLYAAACPERVRRLVIIEGLGVLDGSERQQLPRLQAFLTGLRSPPAPMAVASPADAAARLRKRHPRLDPRHAEILAEHGTVQTAQGWRWAFDPLHIVKGPYPPSEEQLCAVIAAVEAPTLLLWGSAGWYGPERIAARSVHFRQVQSATLEGGHMLPYDNPAGLAAAIDPFLDAS